MGGWAEGDGRTVELVQAFLWTCEDCGRDNFERAVTLDPGSLDPGEVTEDDEAAWLAFGGSILRLMAPERVRCGHCGSAFGTGEPGDGDGT